VSLLSITDAILRVRGNGRKPLKSLKPLETHLCMEEGKHSGSTCSTNIV
jgi:hypothetical protein